MTHDEFRWQAFFRRSRDPLFLLSRQRRFLFVNRAWEALTGLSFATVRGLACTRRRPAVPTALDAVTRVLCPPPEVMNGAAVHVRRLSRVEDTAWEIDFLPFRDGDRLLGILGRITAESALVPLEEPVADQLLALRAARARRFGPEVFESSLPSVRRTADQARIAAQTTAGVLIVGEPGSGKQWLARSIHHLGPRRHEPFAALDCGRLSAAALDQALFGDGGLIHSGTAATVYLGDVNLLSRDLQNRLVEVLTEPEPGTPRLVAGSASDLTHEVRSLRVLDEFLCRIGTLVIELPPLRERLADLPRMAEMFLARAVQRDPEGKAPEPPTVTLEALDLLRSYGWPGNLAELYTVLTGAAARATAGRITPADLPLALRLTTTAEPGGRLERTIPLATLLEETERRLIQLALKQSKGNKTRAAELLGVYKPLLYRRMAALGLKDD